MASMSAGALARNSAGRRSSRNVSSTGFASTYGRLTAAGTPFAAGIAACRTVWVGATAATRSAAMVRNADRAGLISSGFGSDERSFEYRDGSAQNVRAIERLSRDRQCILPASPEEAGPVQSDQLGA